MSIINQWNSNIVYGYPGLIIAFICCTLFSNITAICIGYGRRGKSSLMIDINAVFSLVLFLIPIRKKITLWAIVLQVFNIISVLVYTAFYKILLINPHIFDPKFRAIYSYSFFLILSCMLVNFIYNSIKYS